MLLSSRSFSSNSPLNNSSTDIFATSLLSPLVSLTISPNSKKFIFFSYLRLSKPVYYTKNKSKISKQTYTLRMAEFFNRYSRYDQKISIGVVSEQFVKLLINGVRTLRVCFSRVCCSLLIIIFILIFP